MKIGEKIKNFKLKDFTGTEHNLYDYMGQKIIIYFYPKDNTPGCSTQACNYRDRFEDFEKLNVKLIAISRDSINSHKKFIEKYNLPFLILSDESKEICEYFDVLKEKSMFGKKYFGIVRSTFILDENCILTHEFRNVSYKDDTDNILNILKNKVE